MSSLKNSTTLNLILELCSGIFNFKLRHFSCFTSDYGFCPIESYNCYFRDHNFKILSSMEITTIDIKKGQYLSDIMKFIPENAIISKTLPGIGATYCEIMSERNSIIIEPNVPVIIGKREKHPNILGVVEGIGKQDVINYLKGEVEFKKIITTPESYYKVQKAFKQLGINPFGDYFLLIDECERITQDIDYRDTIDAPMEDFWKFKNRSFISATAMTSSSDKFELNHFKHILIKPDFDCKKDLNLLITPNVLATVKVVFNPEVLDKTNKNDCYCYFINSVDMINCIIKELNIKDVSNIYCSADSLQKLKELQYENVFSNLGQMNKINFFTGRFFSAVDIEIDCKPDVIIVTDVKFAAHSMILPMTESIQIAGRFRNGIESLTHISNIDNEIPFTSIDDLTISIEQSKYAYDQIYTLYETAPNEIFRTVIKEALQRVEIAKILNSEGYFNSFKLDNILIEQFLKNTYFSNQNLLEAYESSEFFNVKYFDCKSYKFSDYKFFYKAATTKKKIWKDIVNQLDNINLSSIDDNIYEVANIERKESLIVSSFLILGKDYIESVNFDESKLVIALAKKAEERGETLHPFMDAILETFKVDWDYTEKDIKEKLKNIYSEFEIENTPKATDLNKYFDLSLRKTIWGRKEKGVKEVKGYRVLSAKFTKKRPGTKFNFI